MEVNALSFVWLALGLLFAVNSLALPAIVAAIVLNYSHHKIIRITLFVLAVNVFTLALTFSALS